MDTKYILFHPVSKNQSRRGGTSLVILHPNELTKTLAQTWL
jgi:hypothetical protein